MDTRNWEQRNDDIAPNEPIENSNPRDWSFIKQINGQIRLKEKIWIYVENWKWETDSSKKVAQEIAEKLKSHEGSVEKKQTEPDSWELTNCLCHRKGILLLWRNRELASVHPSQTEKEIILSEQRGFHEYLEKEAEQAFQG